MNKQTNKKTEIAPDQSRQSVRGHRWSTVLAVSTALAVVALAAVLLSTAA